MRLYKSCDSLSIYNLDNITKTGDLRYLVVGFDAENDELELNKSQLEEMQEILNKIMFTFSVQSGTISLETQIKSKIELK